MSGWRAEQVPPKSGRAWRLAAGSVLKVVDAEGGQTGDVFAVAADDREDGLSNGRTFDHGDTIRLSTGSVLHSRRGRALLTIVADEVGVHDFLYAPCGSCSAALTASLAAFDVPAAAVTTAFNVFMNVAVGPDGTLNIRPPVSTAGQGVTFAAERDVLVAVTACPAAGANGGAPARSLGIEIRGAS